MSEIDLVRKYTFEALDLNDDGVMDEEEVKQAELLSKVMPKFKFSNLTGKKVSFKFENETHDGNEDDFNEEDNFAFTL